MADPKKSLLEAVKAFKNLSVPLTGASPTTGPEKAASSPAVTQPQKPEQTKPKA